MGFLGSQPSHKRRLLLFWQLSQVHHRHFHGLFVGNHLDSRPIHYGKVGFRDAERFPSDLLQGMHVKWTDDFQSHWYVVVALSSNRSRNHSLAWAQGSSISDSGLNG